MKKPFLILLTLVLIFLSACQKNNENQQIITTDKNSTTITLNDSQTFNGNQTTTVFVEITTTENTKTTNKVAHDIEEAPPYNIVDFDIKKMKSALVASKTMNDEEFEKYLILNYPYAHNCELTTPKLYDEYIENVSEIRLAVVDNNYENVGVAHYYFDNKNATQIVYTTGTQRFVVDINPLVIFEENEKTEMVKSIQTESFSADIFWSDVWNSYAGNIYFEGETYTFRVYEMDNIELVESELLRLSFVRIGDLLAE